MGQPTPPSIKLTTEWLDIFEASGIPVGTQLLITTRGKHTAYLAESVAEPEGVDGIQLYAMRQAIVDEGSPGLWARADHSHPHTLIIVQVDEV